MLLGAYELLRSRGSTWPRSLALVVLAPLAVLVTPYGPVDTVRYYHLLLVDPPFAGRVTEWRWPEPAANTVAFYVLLAMTIPLVIWGRRRLTAFDVAVLVITLVGALTAIRGIPWFAFACMVFVPVAIGQRLESKKPGEPRRGLNLAIATGSPLRSWPSQARCSPATTRGSRSTGRVIRSRQCAVSFGPAIASSLRIASRTGCCTRSPSSGVVSRTTCASSSTTASSTTGFRTTTFEDGASWKSFADGYRIVIVDETRTHRRRRTS